MRCLICVLITYKPLTQLVNMCVDSLGNSSIIFLRVVCIAINSTLKMFCRLDNVTTSSFALDWL